MPSVDFIASLAGFLDLQDILDWVLGTIDIDDDVSVSDLEMMLQEIGGLMEETPLWSLAHGADGAGWHA